MKGSTGKLKTENGETGMEEENGRKWERKVKKEWQGKGREGTGLEGIRAVIRRQRHMSGNAAVIDVKQITNASTRQNKKLN